MSILKKIYKNCPSNRLPFYKKRIALSILRIWYNSYTDISMGVPPHP